MNKKIFSWLIIILVITSATGYYYLRPSKDKKIAPKTQTDSQPMKTEAPTDNISNNQPPKDWKTFNDPLNQISFQYPESLTTNYISLQDWPPKVQIIDAPYSCTQAGSETARAGKTEEKIINEQKYCVTTKTEGAAGSLYSQYAYASSFKNNKTIILTFSLRFVQCGNYDTAQKTQCQKERQEFALDDLVGQIFETLR